MEFKAEKCCFCTEFFCFRLVCIVNGIVGLLIEISVVGLLPDTAFLEGIPFILIGIASMSFAVMSIKGSTHERMDAIIIYIGTRVLLVFIAILRWPIILPNPYSGSLVLNISRYFKSYVLLNVFCSLGAVLFYQESKSKNAEPQQKSEQDIECK